MISGHRIRPRVLVTGAAGAVGSILAERWASRLHLAGTDRVPSPQDSLWDEWFEFDLEDTERLAQLACQYEHVVHLATGAPEGWGGLRVVEVEATRAILVSRYRSGLSGRVILASSNHVVGGIEADWLAQRRQLAPSPITESPRPDSEYGAAKLFVEAYGRYAAECLGASVSCVRIGTFRRVDDIEAYVDAPEFAYLGDSDAVRMRLRQTWLNHSDLDSVMTEEIGSADAYRLRYAYSSPSDWLWTHDVLRWNRG